MELWKNQLSKHLVSRLSRKVLKNFNKTHYADTLDAKE